MTDDLPNTAPPTAPPPAPKKAGNGMGVSLWLVIAGIIGLLIFFFKDNEAFPSASLDLKLSRPEIVQLSQKWCRKVGYDPQGNIESTVFNFDNTAKTFLEFEFGSARANELMRTEMPIWYWRSRFCRELQNEDVRVYVSPAGKLIALNRRLPNDRAIASVSHEEAQKLARQFIENDAQVSLKDYALTNDSKENLAARVDHSFTWERTLTDLHGAKMRAYALVSGDKVSRYHYQLYVPEAWQERFATMRSYNALLGSIASVLYDLLRLSVMFVLFYYVAKHQVRWRFALISGAILAVGFALSSLNNWSTVLDDYDTTKSLQVYFTQYAESLTLQTLMLFGIASCFVAAGEVFYRRNYPEKLAVESYFKIKGLSTKQASFGLVAGFCGFGIAVGWVVFYYLIGERIGFWCPLGITNFEILSSAFPFYSAICLGVQAALSEEVLYRVLGMSFAQKLVRNFWLANLIQAAAWGFMHSTYPQQPAYARGIELTCSGLVFGWLMKRYGLMACLIAHYLLDAFLDSQTSLRSSVPSLQISALIPILPLVLVALFSYIRSRKKEASADEPLLNWALPVVAPASAPAVVEESAPFVYQPLSTRVRMALVVSTLVALPIGTFLRSAPAVGDGFKLSINREEAIKIASEVMRHHHIGPHQYLKCAWVEDDISRSQVESNPMQYAFEKVGLKRVLEMVQQTASGFVWRVRFFKPEDRTEYEVNLDGQGKEISFDITKPEEAPGARLKEADARLVAENYLAEVRPNLGAHELDNVAEDQEANRTDYQFKFKVPGLKVGDAEFKVAANVIGDESSQVAQDWDLPDQWRFDKRKTSRRVEIARLVKYGFFAVIAVATIWWMIGVLRTGTVRWRSAILLAIPVALLSIPIEINDLPTVLRYYATNMPFSSFAFRQVLELVKGMMSKLAEILLMCAFAAATCRLLFPKLRLSNYFRTCIVPESGARLTQRSVWMDAILAAYWLVVIDWLVDCIAFSVEAHFSPNVPSKVLSNVCLNANVYSALGDNALNAATRGVQEMLQVGIFAGMYAKYISTGWMFLLLTVVSNVINCADARYWQDVVVSSITGICSTLVYWLFVLKLARKNVLAYFIAGFAALIFRRIPALLGDALPHFLADVVSIIVLLLLPVFYVLFLFLRRRTADAAAQDTSGQDTSAQDLAAHDAIGQDATAKEAGVQDATARDATAKEAGVHDATTHDATAKEAGVQDATASNATRREDTGRDATTGDAAGQGPAEEGPTAEELTPTED